MSNNNNNNKLDESIKYKSIYTNNNNEANIQNSDYNSIEKLLIQETNDNKLQPWNKLNKLIKSDKIRLFTKEYINKNNIIINNSEKILYNTLIAYLNKGKLSKKNEVNYSLENETIINIPGLIHLINDNSITYNIKNSDSHVSTLKNLAPKRKNTLKKKNQN
jgi:hypothetical protein